MRKRERRVGRERKGGRERDTETERAEKRERERGMGSESERKGGGKGDISSIIALFCTICFCHLFRLQLGNDRGSWLAVLLHWFSFDWYTVFWNVMWFLVSYDGLYCALDSQLK